MHLDRIEAKPARGSIFPPGTDDGVYLAATDISYQITSGVFEQSTARILSGIKFVAEPKTMTAILGPSGSGKTSLLNILSGRLASSGNKLVGGSIYLNGKKVTSKDLKTRCSYVMQNETTIPYLTIEETLLYSAELRLPFLSAKERREKVRILLNDLGLVHCMHSIVGDEKVRSISGGERKRVILGIELISDPRVLFIDEPTSGLDAFMAFQILQLLIKLAKTGRTIVCTIHQPRTQVFQAFDEILLLSKGEVVYHGPSKSSIDYFASIGHPVPENYNPTDYFLDLLVPRSNIDKFADNRLHSITYEQLRVLPELYLSSEYNERIVRKIDDHMKRDYSPISELSLFSNTAHTCCGWLKKKLFAFGVVVKRSFMNNARNITGSLIIGILMNAFIAVVIGITSWVHSFSR
ncbi:ABC-2 type transporter family protein [Cryptosporidium felis]|nr:ABC-2 type transporter family protein [Cryptosporidium felis]